MNPCTSACTTLPRIRVANPWKSMVGRCFLVHHHPAPTEFVAPLLLLLVRSLGTCACAIDTVDPITGAPLFHPVTNPVFTVRDERVEDSLYKDAANRQLRKALLVVRLCDVTLWVPPVLWEESFSLILGVVGGGTTCTGEYRDRGGTSAQGSKDHQAKQIAVTQAPGESVWSF